MIGSLLSRPVEILLVEDNPGDVRLTMEVMKDSRILNNISVARDGVEALDHLNKKGRFKNAPTPDLVILDLNIPKKEGKEVLSEIKTSARHKKIPVLILSSSKADSDIMTSYELYANCYITKPQSYEDYSHVVKAIENFWFSLAQLPISY